MQRITQQSEEANRRLQALLPTLNVGDTFTPEQLAKDWNVTKEAVEGLFKFNGMGIAVIKGFDFTHGDDDGTIRVESVPNGHKPPVKPVREVREVYEPVTDEQARRGVNPNVKPN